MTGAATATAAGPPAEAGATPGLGGLAPALVAPLREIVGLKRVRHGGRSLAARGFARGWAALARGEEPARVALSETAAAVAALTMGGIDDHVLAEAGLAPRRIAEIRRGAIAERAGQLGHGVATQLAEAAPPTPGEGEAPAFCARLEAEPRAGATFPGKPRLAPPLPENHAEHCWATGVMAVLILLGDPAAGERPDEATLGEAWLMAMGHHLHNARLPDGGYAAEMALGDDLDRVLAAFTEHALGTLDPALAARLRTALAAKDAVAAPAAAAFTAADTIDRVLELEAWETALGFRLDEALGDRELVHPGPLQRFQGRALAQAGLAAGGAGEVGP